MNNPHHKALCLPGLVLTVEQLGGPMKNDRRFERYLSSWESKGAPRMPRFPQEIQPY